MLKVSPSTDKQLLENYLSEELHRVVSSHLSDIYSSESAIRSSNISLNIDGESKHFHLAVSRLTGENRSTIGAVILIDELTALVNAQRMAAWQEVARRIAHEIKNPLTPIQLSAQRIQRRLNRSANNDLSFIEIEDRRAFLESTESIVNQVQILRTLVNEFSRFARMPKSNPELYNLNEVVNETVEIYRQTKKDVKIISRLDNSIPQILIDKVQIGQLIVNLIDNALNALEIAEESANSFTPRIDVRTSYKKNIGMATLSISDNGLGISAEDKPRLFQPYFSKTQGGSGLGLAIVSTIASDHNAFIRVKDNEPAGSSFIVEFPRYSRFS